MPLDPNNPAAPSLGDARALVNAITSQNQVGYVSGLTAHVGGGQTSALQLSQLAPLAQVDTVASDHDSVKLPPAIPGSQFVLVNNGAHILDVYGFSSTDTVNGSTSAFSMNTLTSQSFACAKSGNWGAT